MSEARAAAVAPVAFFGFDGGEPAVIERGIAEGWLPTMRRLLEEGQGALLAPPPSRFFNTSWIAMVTGRDVFEHRAVLDRQLDSGSYRILDVNAESVQRPPFWSYLSEAGLSSTVVSIYSSPLVPGLRGSQVQGWGAIDPYSAKFGQQRFDPPELEALLAAAVPSRQRLYHTVVPQTAAEYRAYRDRLLRSIEEQTRGLSLLLEQTRWDFFIGSYGEPHHGGHLLWHLSDPEHALYDPVFAAEVGETITAVYRAVDAGIGELLERLPVGTRRFVVNPHGMRPSYVDEPGEQILEASGWLVRRSGGSGGSLRGQVLRAGWSVGRRVVPTRLRLAARSRLPDDGLVASMALAHIDWARTKVFALPSDMTSYLRVNLAGREPEGIVQPGEEYARVCAEVEQLFLSLRHTDGGPPAVERVVRYDEALARPAEGPLPDLCVVWDDTQPVRALDLPEQGRIELGFNDPRTGQHRHLGFLVGAGPGIAASGSQRLSGHDGSLLDVGPTVLALFGLDPSVLPGTPLEGFTAP